MSQSAKKKKQQRRIKERELVKVDPPDQRILDSIGSPNVWTPETESAWLEELKKVSTEEIYRRFPPMKKPGNVRKRGKSIGWGD
jgi:hypothetical protein